MKPKTKIQKELFALADSGYRDFHSKLIPNIEYERIIGVRTPALRKYAASLNGTPEAEAFLGELPHAFYEENNLHAFLIEKVRDFDKALVLTERFLPYIDNWATCDCFAPKVFAKNLPFMRRKATEWISSGETYTVRYGVGVLMRYFLDGDIKTATDALEEVAAIKSEEYYVNMMCAWFFATALAKKYELALPYFENRRLLKDVHNKAIRKAVESFRVTDDAKAHLRTLTLK